MWSIFCFIVLQSVSAYTEANFVAGGYDALSLGQTMSWSQTGKTWFPISSPFSTMCNGVVYSPDSKSWVALGAGLNTMAYSVDGKSWIGLGNSVFPTQGNRIAYSSDQKRWVATGQPGTLAYSADGFNWNAANVVFTTESLDVAYGNNVWVAVGSGTNNIAKSNDGMVWTGLGVSIFGVTGQGLSVNFANSLFVAGGVSSSFPFGVSADGITWTGKTGLFSNQVADASYGQGKWIITGPATPLPTPFANSTDGISWIMCLPQSSINNGKSIIYHAQYDRWVTTGSGPNSLVYSDDGNDWVGAGNSFQLTGFDLATTGTFLTYPPLLTGTIPPNSGSLTIDVNATGIVQTDVHVSGDLYLLGSLRLEAEINITETVVITGSLLLTVSSPPLSRNETGRLICKTLVLESPRLTIILGFRIVQPLVLSVAQYSYRNANQFQLEAIQSLGQDNCLTQTAYYEQTLLSVLIRPVNCPDLISIGGSDGTIESGNGINITEAGTGGSPFPVWAIVIISISCLAIGTLIGTGVWLFNSQSRKKKTIAIQARLRAGEVQNLQTAFRVTHDNPSV